MSSKSVVEIVVTGTPGVGKSTLVNAIVGKRVAYTGGSLRRNRWEEWTAYEGTAEDGARIVVWDSLGLQDDEGKQKEYLIELKKKCSNVDVVIYCIDLSATRSYGLSAAEVAPNDLSAIRKLTATFGPSWWKRSIFAMTRANVLVSALKVKPDFEKKFSDRLQEWKERIHATLIATGVPEEEAHKIPVEPVGHPKKPHLPGREQWLSALWRTIVTSVTPPSAPPSVEEEIDAGEKDQGTSDPFSSTKRVEILITGTPGVGKSTLVNALAGKRIADTGDPLLRDGQNKVFGYQWTAWDGSDIVVWDSPGLEEGSVTDCLTQLSKKCRNPTVVIYCMDLSATRSYGLSAAEVTPNDLFAIKKLTATFGCSLWKRSIFALTRGNVLESALRVKEDPEDKFYERLQEWEERVFTTLIANGVPKEVSFKVPVEPVGHPKKPRLVDVRDWVGELWDIIMKTATPSAAKDLPHLSDMSGADIGTRGCNQGQFCCVSYNNQ